MHTNVMMILPLKKELSKNDIIYLVLYSLFMEKIL